ncbi:MAG: ABC transporter substrate-binding protein, partial [Gammaproteobacteria bacterium]|nr:ABC transporter substrate-binding protein [Gammaproteobacteria bacterium]
RNRAIEAASLTLDEALGLVHDNYPLKIILIHDVSNGADSILARNNIKTLKDIKGKTVAVESGALGAYVLSRSLELNGLKIQDVKIKHLDVNAHERAFLRNEVDVVVNFEPVRTRLLKQGAKEIFSSREMYGEIVDVLVVHEDTYQYHQQHLRHLVDSWFKALDYFEQNKQTAAGIMAKRLKVSPHEVISSFAGLELGSLSINQKLLSGNPPSLKATMKLLERVLQENGLVNSTLETSNLITDQFLR